MSRKRDVKNSRPSRPGSQGRERRFDRGRHDGRHVAVQTIKSMAYRPWMGRPRSASTWYEPLEDPSDIQQALDWALGRPGIFVITSGDVNLLPKILNAAERASQERPSDADMERMVERLQMEPLFV